MHTTKLLQLSLLSLALLGFTGCSSIVSSATGELANNLSRSIMSQQDPLIVEDAIPSYLLLLDAMLYSDQDNTSLLASAAVLNSSYASLFIDDKHRQRLLTAKSLDYAKRAICILDPEYCLLQDMPFKQFELISVSIDQHNIEEFYALGSSWAGWIQAHSDDWNAIAQLSRVELIMQRIAEIDETYQYAGSHLYLGAIASLLPPAMGGKPELAKHHFEKAIALSQGNNLFAKTTYAERYCRLVFDRKCHDDLLKQVIDAQPDINELNLMNAIAKQKARQLLASADDYF